jgi:hypothetical protein
LENKIVPNFGHLIDLKTKVNIITSNEFLCAANADGSGAEALVRKTEHIAALCTLLREDGHLSAGVNKRDHWVV